MNTSLPEIYSQCTGNCLTRPKWFSQLVINIIAICDVPFLPYSPRSLYASSEYIMMYFTTSGGMTSRSNRQLSAFIIVVGPQSYSVFW